MNEEIEKRLERSSLTSDVITHNRLKHFAKAASTSEDHISRIGIGLSVRQGAVDANWKPEQIKHDPPMSVLNPKSIRGRTILKDDFLVFAALISQHQQPENYDGWRQVIQCHWERGVQQLTEIAGGESDWILILQRLSESHLALV